MFLCDDCHSRANCTLGFIEAMHRSRGACEVCHRVANCYDCHGYDYRKKPKKEN